MRFGEAVVMRVGEKHCMCVYWMAAARMRENEWWVSMVGGDPHVNAWRAHRAGRRRSRV